MCLFCVRVILVHFPVIIVSHKLVPALNFTIKSLFFLFLAILAFSILQVYCKIIFSYFLQNASDIPCGDCVKIRTVPKNVLIGYLLPPNPQPSLPPSIIGNEHFIFHPYSSAFCRVLCKWIIQWVGSWICLPSFSVQCFKCMHIVECFLFSLSWFTLFYLFSSLRAFGLLPVFRNLVLERTHF